jgi:hypothetical protein
MLLHQANHGHGCASFRRRYKLEDHDPPTDVPSTGAQQRHPTPETARREQACLAASGKYIEIGASWFSFLFWRSNSWFAICKELWIDLLRHICRALHICKEILVRAQFKISRSSKTPLDAMSRGEHPAIDDGIAIVIGFLTKHGRTDQRKVL